MGNRKLRQADSSVREDFFQYQLVLYFMAQAAQFHAPGVPGGSWPQVFFQHRFILENYFELVHDTLAGLNQAVSAGFARSGITTWNFEFCVFLAVDDLQRARQPQFHFFETVLWVRPCGGCVTL